MNNFLAPFFAVRTLASKPFWLALAAVALYQGIGYVYPKFEQATKPAADAVNLEYIKVKVAVQKLWD